MSDVQINPNLASRLTEARERAHLTQTELARLVGVNRSAVGQWETGRTVPTRINLRRIAEVLRVSLAWLTGRPEETRPFPGAHFEGGVVADGELVKLEELAANLREPLASAARGKRAEIWRLKSDALAGAGYRPNEYLVVDLDQPPSARDVVLAEQHGVAIFRVYFPPYLFAAPLGRQIPPLAVDNFSVVIRGVVVARFSLP